MCLRVVVLLCCSVLLSACGGDEGAEPAAGTPAGTADAGGVEESDWAAEVNAICDRNREASEDLAADVRGEGLAGRQAAAEVLERAVPVQERMLGELEAVDAPDDLQADYDRFVARIGDALALFPELASAVRGEQNDPELTTEFVQIAADTRPFATEHGLMACVPDAGS